MVGLFRVYLNNLVNMTFLVKVMVPEWILVVTSSMIPFVLELQYQAKSLWFSTLCESLYF